jgi:HAD superfamily phosphoserine phosphatase-like hydrolase
MKHPAIRLVAFDLDGTLLRHQTVCEVLASQLGTSERMQQFESLHRSEDIQQARKEMAEMAEWYRSRSRTQLCAFLQKAHFAPGVREAMALLKQHDIHLALISLTWEFAVAWFAQQWGIQHFVGTRLSEVGEITPFWPEDKATWLTQLAQRLQLDLKQVAAVGDSSSDLSMLRIVGYPLFVGQTLPEELPPETHIPQGNIYEIAQRIVAYQPVH